MGESSVAQTSTSASVPIANARGGWTHTVRNILTSYPYLILALFFFIGWQILPIYSALSLSFTDDKFLDDAPANFIGLQNYRNVLSDHLFWQGIQRAVIFTLIFLPGMIFIPMVAAIFIDRISSNRVATVYRIILLIPAMIPAPLIFVLWLWMYNNYIGPINYILVDKLHLFDLATQPQWLQDSRLIYLLDRRYGVVVGPWLSHHVFPGGTCNDSQRYSRRGPRRWRRRMAHVLGHHYLATPPDHSGSDGRSLR